MHTLELKTDLLSQSSKSMRERASVVLLLPRFTPEIKILRNIKNQGNSLVTNPTWAIHCAAILALNLSMGSNLDQFLLFRSFKTRIFKKISNIPFERFENRLRFTYTSESFSTNSIS